MFRRLTHAGLKAPPDHTGRRLPLGEKEKKAPPVCISQKTSAVRGCGGDGRMRGGQTAAGGGQRQAFINTLVLSISSKTELLVEGPPWQKMTKKIPPKNHVIMLTMVPFCS